VDRHFFFKHTLLYKKYITNLVILAIQFICFVLVTGLLKGRFLYQSIKTHSFKFNNLIENDIATAITSVFMGICLLYVPLQQLLENHNNRKKQKQSVTRNNTNSIESDETTKGQFGKSDQDDRENIEETNIIENSPKNSSEKNSSSSLETNSRHSRQPDNNKIPDGHNHPDKDSSTNVENQQQNFSQSELQSYQSIKTNIQANFFFSVSINIFGNLSVLSLILYY